MSRSINVCFGTDEHRIAGHFRRQLLWSSNDVSSLLFVWDIQVQVPSLAFGHWDHIED